MVGVRLSTGIAERQGESFPRWPLDRLARPKKHGLCWLTIDGDAEPRLLFCLDAEHVGGSGREPPRLRSRDNR